MMLKTSGITSAVEEVIFVWVSAMGIMMLSRVTEIWKYGLTSIRIRSEGLWVEIYTV